MKGIFNKTLTKIIIGSLIFGTVCSSIVYLGMRNEFNNKLVSLEKEILDLKKQNVELSNKELEKEYDNLEVKSEDVKKDSEITNEVKKESEKEMEQDSFSSELIDVMVNASNDLNRVYEKITSSGTFSGLQGTFDTLYEYGLMLEDLLEVMDLSLLGGNETKEIIQNIAIDLKNISDEDNITDKALDLMGNIGEFTYYIETNYSK